MTSPCSLAAAVLGSSDGDWVCCSLAAGLVVWLIYRAAASKDEAKASPPTSPLSRPFPEEYSSVAFDPIRDSHDARGQVPIFGLPVTFSSALEANRYPNIITGLTLNKDFIAVRRGAYGVKAFLLDESLTIDILPGCPAGFNEGSAFTMELTSDDEAARFPISFRGWMQIVDAARRGGATIELDQDLPEELKSLIGTVLPGDEALKPARTKAAGSRKDVARETGRCGSCGASLGRKSSCDYCGAAQ